MVALLEITAVDGGTDETTIINVDHIQHMTRQRQFTGRTEAKDTDYHEMLTRIVMIGSPYNQVFYVRESMEEMFQRIERVARKAKAPPPSLKDI